MLRVEDLDGPRVRPGAERALLEDLAWLGLDWDEGPDRGGPHAPYRQSERFDRYRAAFERLRERGAVYPCFCSRKDVAAAASAPQLPGEEAPYPRSCRGIPPAEAGRRIADGRRHAWRFRVPSELPSFDDAVCGTQVWEPSTIGDFVVLRSDGVASYQLAVVVDDADMRITEVVRGADLLRSTARQLLLYGALGLEPPRFAHVPLLLGDDGIRLSKRHRGSSLAECRQAGMSPREIVGRVAAWVGLADTPRAVRPDDLRDGFAFGRIRRPDGEGIRVPGVTAT